VTAVVWSSFSGRYSDSPRALYEALLDRGEEFSHTWLVREDRRSDFPVGVATAVYGSPAGRRALESADVVVANNGISLEWDKSPATTYLQTWHGTPLKRMHHDVADPIGGRLTALDRGDQSFVCVDTSTVAEEEVKYTLDEEGCIAELSKTVVGGLGEAVGINYVSAADKPVLVEHLAACADTDYFERAVETAIHQAGVRFRPLDISRFSAVEVDFEDDLARANTWLRSRTVLEPMAAEFG
jgi:hypothetical protein